jgi:outer membrane protein OmpA-like peptidoglycan-associated protein
MSFAPNDKITPRSGKILITGGGFNRIINVTQDGKTNHLSVTPSVNQVSNQAGVTYYEIEATSDWKAVEDIAWFSIAPDKGTGNGQIMVTFKENKANATRVGQIFVTSGELSQTISLTQDRTTPPPIPIERNVILKGVNFHSGSSELTDDSFVILDEAAASLAFYPDVEVEIQGHTDSTGSLALNNRLSLARAETVKTYLINKGIAENRMTVKGFGPASPIAPNDTAEGRAQNRRIEFSRTK